MIDAAREEFLLHGYRAATMERIARSAGVSKRTLYLWHRDKAALFEACIVDGTAELDLPPLDPGTDLEASLHEYGAALLPALSSDYSLKMTRLLFREGPEFEAVRHALEVGSGLITAPVADLLAQRGIAADDAGRLAEAFIVMLLSGIQRAAAAGTSAPDADDGMRHLNFVIRLFREGLQPWQFTT
ncbi:TetR/AcrR family transcriptional regulator [Sphingomonas melonis]|uniref:AcrR family transcriptional regulator n=1 Tax=Sphingomonas melonis TaxID=152682 RepID=A0A7Y9K1Q6_9SPHN|nr:AcrR family transcriptional regulator [Sphingomonas melonis]